MLTPKPHGGIFTTYIFLIRFTPIFLFLSVLYKCVLLPINATGNHVHIFKCEVNRRREYLKCLEIWISHQQEQCLASPNSESFPLLVHSKWDILRTQLLFYGLDPLCQRNRRNFPVQKQTSMKHVNPFKWRIHQVTFQDGIIIQNIDYFCLQANFW